MVRSRFFKGIRFILLVMLIGLLALGSGNRALASVHEYPAPDGGQLLRSLQTLRDADDRAWQLVLFKQVSPTGATQVHLRLVGFPGLLAFQRGEPLVITLEAINAQLAPDVSPDFLSANAGEYDLKSAIAQITSPVPLRVNIPLQTDQLELVIPPFVVREWKQVAQWQP